jgi:hypothetical protein
MFSGDSLKTITTLKLRIWASWTTLVDEHSILGPPEGRRMDAARYNLFKGNYLPAMSVRARTIRAIGTFRMPVQRRGAFRPASRRSI